MPTLSRELLLYGLLSGLALGVDTGVCLLAIAQGASWPLAAGLGFGLGLLVSYAGSTCFVFRQHRLKDRRAEFVIYGLIGGCGLLLTQLSLWFWLALLHLPPLTAKLLSAIAAAVLAFANPMTDRSALIIGAGPAGLSAATVAAECGHDVTLFDSSDSVGGQFKVAMQIPGKEEFAETIRYFKRKLETTGVDLRLNTRVSVDDLVKG
eukprot:gene47972-58760_t